MIQQSILLVGLMAVLAVGIRWRATESSLWVALALLGQAMALQLVVAGPTVSYQHYLPISALGRDGPVVPQLALLMQSVVVAVAVWRRWPKLARWVKVLRPWQWLILIAGMFISSSALSRDSLLYLAELFLATYFQVLFLVTVTIALNAVPDRTVSSVRAWIARRRTESQTKNAGFDRWAVAGAIYVTALATFLAVFVYERHPHLSDEVVHLIQAKYFTHAMLQMPLPAVTDAFEVDLMRYTADTWYSPVPPGWPAMLALGVLFGVPWLVNPILGGINVLMAFSITRRIYDRRLARVVVALLCTSPWYVFMAMNLMTHTFALTAALVAIIGVLRLTDTRQLRWAWMAGAAIAMVSLIRPLDGVAVAMALGVWTLFIPGKSFRFAPIGALVISTMVFGSVQLFYNASLTGHPMLFPLMEYFDALYGVGVNALGFGPDRGVAFGWTGLDPIPGHGMIDVLVNANLNVSATNVELFGWAAGSFVMVFLLFLLNRARRADWLALGCIVLVAGIQSLYWFSGGPDFAARYWYLIILPMVVLTARGVRALTERLHDVDGMEGWQAQGLVAILALGALLTFFPWRATDKYPNYRSMEPGIRILTAEHGLDQDDIVLIRGRRFPDYASAASYNPVDVRGDGPVYVWDRGPAIREELARAYEDRTFWFVDGPTHTGRSYELVAGPLTSSNVFDEGLP